MFGVSESWVEGLGLRAGGLGFSGLWSGVWASECESSGLTYIDPPM